MSFLFKGHFQKTSLMPKTCLLAKRAYFGKDLVLNMFENSSLVIVMYTLQLRSLSINMGQSELIVGVLVGVV